MNESQILNLALTTVPTMTVVLIGILMNNARLTDVKEALRAEIRVVDNKVDAIREVVRAELGANRAELGTSRAELAANRTEMEKNHSEMLHRFGDLDARLTRIENSLGINRN